MLEFTDLLKEKINEQNPTLIEKAIGTRESKFLVFIFVKTVKESYCEVKCQH